MCAAACANPRTAAAAANCRSANAPSKWGTFNKWPSKKGPTYAEPKHSWALRGLRQSRRKNTWCQSGENVVIRPRVSHPIYTPTEMPNTLSMHEMSRRTGKQGYLG